MESGIAIIVNGDVASRAVPVGGYAYIKNNTHGLSEGLYRNISTSAFPVSGGTANGTVFEAVSNGGLNSIIGIMNTVEIIDIRDAFTPYDGYQIYTGVIHKVGKIAKLMLTVIKQDSSIFTGDRHNIGNIAPGLRTGMQFSVSCGGAQTVNGVANRAPANALLLINGDILCDLLVQDARQIYISATYFIA